jgi:streptogramin lyase
MRLEELEDRNAPTASLSEFPVTTTGSSPLGITAGPDGNFWFTEYSKHKIAKITPAGVITNEYALTTGRYPYAITAGSDGNLWFTESGTSYIGRITRGGTVTEYGYGISAGAGLLGITAGPDGNLWFTENSTNKIGRMGPGGVLVAEYPASGNPYWITAGPDGNLWFTEQYGNKVGRITTSGSLTEFALSPGALPEGITVGPDGNLWIAEWGANKIARMTTTGALLNEWACGSYPVGITAGPDGNLYIAESSANKIGIMTISGGLTEVPMSSSYPGFLVADRTGIWFTEENGNKIGHLNLVSISEYTGLAAGSAPSAITAGPDGNLWFTENYANKIGQMSPYGGILLNEYSLSVAANPQAITAGPDGNLWFTEYGTSKIGKMSPAGFLLNEYSLGSSAYLGGITAGPDGNLWFSFGGVVGGVPQVGKITTSGTVTYYACSGTNSWIAAGADGNLWFTEQGANKIGRVSTAGVLLNEFSLPTSNSYPQYIVPGPDGNLWFTEANTNRIGRITTSGSITEFSVPTTSSYLQGMAACADGNLWFTESSNKIGRITPSGMIQEFAVPTANSSPLGITAGPDGSPWFVENGTDKIGSVPLLYETASPPITVTAGQTYNGVIAKTLVFDPAVRASDLEAVVNWGDGAITGATVSGNTGGPFAVTATHLYTSGGSYSAVVTVSNVNNPVILGTPLSPVTCTTTVAVAVNPGLSLTVGPVTMNYSIASGSRTPAFSEFTVPTSASSPMEIAVGADGNLWFAEQTGKIARITPMGQITEFTVPTSGSTPVGITAGHDGNVWFTEYSSNRIGRITPTGTIQEYVVPTPASLPYAITAGPGGNVWFTEYQASKIGEISSTGTFTEYSVTAGSDPAGIATGPDGNLWFTEYYGNKIGRLTPTGALTEFPVPTSGCVPWGIVAGPDGNLWFTEAFAGKIGRITTAGSITEFPLGTGSASPAYIAAGADGNLWFAEESTNRIGQITPNGNITEYSVPTAGSFPFGITAGPDGNLWFTENLGNQIGRVNLDAPAPLQNVIAGQEFSGVLASVASLSTTTRTSDLEAVFDWGDLSSSGGIVTGPTGGPFSVTGFHTYDSSGTYSASLTVTNVNAPAGSANASSTGYFSVIVNAGVSTAVGPVYNLTGIAQFVVPASAPLGITAGPDGNLWFTEYFAGQIGRVTPSGTITEFAVSPTSSPDAITKGPDGNLWITDAGTNKIGRITPGGTVTEYAIPTPALGLYGITAGPDNNIWFTEYTSSRIGRLLLGTGVVTEYPLPAGSNPIGIAAGPDGTLWFTESSSNAIGQITTSGTISSYSLPMGGIGPHGITAGPDGNLWFTEFGGNKIGRITTHGTITEFNVPVSGDPVSIAAGSDGNLWFVSAYSGNLGKITPGGVLTEYAVPAGSPAQIVPGPDGDLWFIDSNKITRVNLPASAALPNVIAGQAFSGVVAWVAAAGTTTRASDLEAVFAWGDSSSSGGIVTGPTGGPFSVTGFHTYNQVGTDLVALTVTNVNADPLHGPPSTGFFSVVVGVGSPAKLGFAAQPANTVTGATLSPAITVQVLDAYGNVVTSDNTDQVTVGIASGPGSFAAGSTATATLVNGVATFGNLALSTPGSYTLSALVPQAYTGVNSNTFTVAPLQVVAGSFTGAPWGFALQFNAPYLVNSLTPVLYGQGYSASAPPPSVTLTQTKDATGRAVNNPVAGSLILNAAINSITFLTANTALESDTGWPILADGTYTAVVRSRGAGMSGFQALSRDGGYLDGLGTGVAGSGDYTATFTVNAAAAREDVLWVPATADGPGQALNAPGNNQVGGGYPVYLCDNTGTVTSVQATLNYDPTLLTVTGVTGAGFSLLGSSTPGQAVLQYAGPALARGTQMPIGFITATVPSGSTSNPMPYKAKDLLHLSGVSINTGTIPGVTGDALHLIAYVGDADGNGSYSSNDAVLITRTALQSDSGFAAYPLVDPVIVADTDGSGFIPADAALQVNEAGVGYPTANLPSPPIPAGAHFTPIANNVDPTLSLPATLQVAANGTVTVPVNIDNADPAGSTGLIRGQLALRYDPAVFTVSATDVHLGSVLASGIGWSVMPTIDQATGQIVIAFSSNTPISSTRGGSLVTIDFHWAGEMANGSYIAVVASVAPTGQQAISTELEDAQGIFTLTPAPANGFDPRLNCLVLPRRASAALDQVFGQLANGVGPLWSV